MVSSKRHKNRDQKAKERGRRGRNKQATTPGAVASSDKDGRKEREKGRSGQSSKSRHHNNESGAPGAESVATPDSRIARKQGRNKTKGHRSHHSNDSPPAAPGAESMASPGSRITRKEARNRTKKHSSGASKDVGSGSSKELGSGSFKSSQDQWMEAVEATTVPGPEKEMSEAPIVAATTAPDVDEIEAARQQGREESQKDFEAASKKQTFKYMLAAFVVLAIVGGVTAGVLSSKSSSSPGDVSLTAIFFPPTSEDCLAVSEGKETEGQSGTTVKSFGVELNLDVPSTIDMDLLRRELELRIQREALPVLVGCNVEGSFTIENNIFVVANSLRTSTSIGDPETCSSNSDGLCSSVDLQLDLFSKDDNVESDVLLDLITEVFQHEGLLEVLKLLSPVEAITFTTAFETLPLEVPSASPSSSPSIRDNSSGSPSQETCDAIASGTAVPGQDDPIVTVKEYDVLMDVTMDIEATDFTSATIFTSATNELEEKIQSLLMPMLAGCTTQRRRLQIQNSIVNALVVAEHSIGTACLPDSESPCYRYVIHLDVFLKNTDLSTDFSAEILALFREAPLVERLGLVSPFKNIIVVDIFSGSFTTASASPSTDPTRAPVTFPTTESPTLLPSRLPSQRPSSAPTATPSLGPTTMPVVGPTLGPTPEPTPGPTPSPTPPPTPGPTLPPTPPPTPGPTLPPTPPPTPPLTPPPTPPPTAPPTPPPTSSPTNRPSDRPSASPSVPRTCFSGNTELYNAVGTWCTSPASIEATYGLIGDWCFDSSVTSMGSLFMSCSSFNEDISRWDVSSVTNMDWMFMGCATFNQPLPWTVTSLTSADGMFQSCWAFNQPLSGWDVSSMINMSGMFSDAKAFNQDLSSWDVSSVTNMSWMFNNAIAFNQPLSAWATKVSSVTNMYGMFRTASAFDQDISSWTLSSVTDMYEMFYDATSLNRNLCAWGSSLSTGVSTGSMFSNTACPNTGDPFPGATYGPFCYSC